MTFTICDSDLYSVYTLQVKIMGKGHEFIKILLSYSWYIINKIITRVVYSSTGVNQRKQINSVENCKESTK